MKAYIGRMVGTIGAHINRRRHSDQTDSQEHELRTVSPTHSVDTSTNEMSQPLSPVERIATPDADEVLYCKNNVMLKYPISRNARSNSHTKENDSHSSTSSLPAKTSSGSVLDNQILVPGFLFIKTRGSKYGSTLILNWAPNSSMRVPDIHVPSQQHVERSNSVNSDYVADSDSGLSLVHSVDHQGPKNELPVAKKFECEPPSCSSVSIDLGLMEKIRIFYNMDDKGFICSGEMVIRGKDKDFKVTK